MTSHVFGPAKLIFNAGGVGPAKFNIRTDAFAKYIYIYGGVSLIMVSPGAPQEHRHGSRVSPEYRATPVARRTGAEPRRVPWWIALVRLGGLPGWSDPSVRSHGPNSEFPVDFADGPQLFVTKKCFGCVIDWHC